MKNFAFQKKIAFSLNREQKIFRVTLIGSVSNVLLLIFKFVAGIVGNSSAMIADAIHSLSDFLTDIIVILFVGISAKPQDASHDYGHGKYETIASFIIGIALLLTAFYIVGSGANKIWLWWNGIDIVAPEGIALVAALFSIAIKELLYRYTAAQGNRLESQVMISNAWHHRSDALSSIGVAIGIGGAMLLGQKWTILDPLASVLVGGLLMRVAYQLLKTTTDELTECSLPENIENEIIETIETVPNVSNTHNLHTRKLGNRIAIEAHIRMDGSLTLNAVHDATTKVEENLKKRFGNQTHIIIHMEPLKA